MYELITKEKVTRYINEQFLMNETNLFDRERENGEIVDERIANIFNHFLGVNVGKKDGLVLINPFGTNHHVSLDDYNIIKDIKNIDELIQSLRDYQLIICEVVEDLQLDERTRLLDAYDELENNTELER